MRVAIAVLPLVLPGACAPPGPSYLDQLNQFVGRPPAEVIAVLGAPDRVYESDQATFLGWTSIRTRWVPGGFWPGFSPYPHRYPGAMGYWAPDRYIQTQCVTTATIRDGRVLGFSLNGDCPR